MYTTKEYLKDDPWVAVINRINSEYLTELQPNSTRLVSLESLGGTETKIVIKPNTDGIDRTDYTYNRLDLSTFFKGDTVKQLTDFSVPTNTFKILEQVSEFNDIVFTLNDFTHVQYDKYAEVYTLNVNPKSLRFVGSLRFQLINTTKKSLSNLGTKREFPLANTWPLGTNGTGIIGQYQLTGYDFTNEREFLKLVKASDVWPSGRKLAAIIEEASNSPWVCEVTTNDYNIAYEVINGEARYKVIYNGPVLPRYTPRKDIANVLVLFLGDLTTNVDGYLLLHYN